jgi:hypothetical protein
LSTRSHPTSPSPFIGDYRSRSQPFPRPESLCPNQGWLEFEVPRRCSVPNLLTARVRILAPSLALVTTALTAIPVSPRSRNLSQLTPATPAICLPQLLSQSSRNILRYPWRIAPLSAIRLQPINHHHNPTPSESSSTFHHLVLAFFYPSHSPFYVTFFSRSCFFFISFMIFSSFLLSSLSETSISQPSFVCLLWVCSFPCV